VAVGALELKFWQAFCGAVSRPDWAAQHWSLGSHAAGDAAAKALCKEVAVLIASEPLSHWAVVFKTADCCTTPVLRMDEALQHAANVAYGSVGYRPTVSGATIPTVTAVLKAIA
jgi:crotonobetainyl-CoA:carnitine CoA-transferase CaiB-like acyl-CoA transferase